MTTCRRVTDVRGLAVTVLLLSIAQIAGAEPPAASEAPFSPAEVSQYLAAEAVKGQPPLGVETTHAMIAGTSNPFAVHAGYEVLRHDGTAADAALTTALAQIALHDGANVSYAGVMVVVGYDAATGKVYSLNAAYNTVKGERSAATIPPGDTPTGRSVLVPGFMAGVQALHDRFGRMPFAQLFDPAIWIAEHGVPLDGLLAKAMRSQEKVLTRTPEGRRIFLKPDGTLYHADEPFRQPELGATLRAVAREGAAYMYHGAWARAFVDQVQRAGGAITLEDLADYHVLWGEPARTTYRGFDVVGAGPPNFGTEIQLDALKIAAAGDLRRFGAPPQSDALYYLIQVRRAAEAEVYAHTHRPGDLLDHETAQRLWHRIERAAPPSLAPVTSPHTSSVVAVDAHGNVVILLHTINTFAWGTTGIFVGGVSIPDSAKIQRELVERVGPGLRLPDPACPLLVLQEGKPAFASVATGYAIPSVTLLHVLDFLDRGTSPLASLQSPYPRGRPATAKTRAESQSEVFAEGDLSADTVERLRAHGLSIAIESPFSQSSDWAGILIDPRHATLSGAVTRALNGAVEGY
jgi:gamma-glutamyltranspeptidase / glutathione hydrolase